MDDFRRWLCETIMGFATFLCRVIDRQYMESRTSNNEHEQIGDFDE